MCLRSSLHCHSRYTHQVCLAALTLVLAAAPAPCGLGQQDFSLPPQLSQGGTLPPLSPDGFRTHDTPVNRTLHTSLPIYVFMFICVCVFLRTYRQLSRFAEGPPASGSLLLEDGDFLCPVRQHVHLASLGSLCPPREAMEVYLQCTYMHTQQRS